MTKRSTAAALTFAFVLGSGATGALTARADTGPMYNSSAAEPDTWVQGHTQIPVLKYLINGTTFLDWARPGLTQNVSVQNNTCATAPADGTTPSACAHGTGQKIYVLQRTKVMFVLADMAAAVASGTITLTSGSALASLGTEAAARALAPFSQWQKDLQARVDALLNTKYTDQQIADGQIYKDTAKAVWETAVSLNGDAQTLYNSVTDLWGRVSKDNAQSNLAEGNPVDDALLGDIKAQAVTIAPGKTKSVRNDDYTSSFNAWRDTQVTQAVSDYVSSQQNKSTPTVGARVIENLGKALGVLNIKGASGWLGQAGFPTVDMYVVRDDKWGAHMTTAPNISWIASSDKITPGDNTPSGDISPLQGIGYYTWRDMTSTTNTPDDQTLYTRAYNALESAGYDAYAATKIIDGVEAGLEANSGSLFKQFTTPDAAKLVLQPNFRRLVWLEYSNGTGPELTRNRAFGAGAQAVKDAVSKASADWARNLPTSLETAAQAGNGAGGFAVWTQDSSNAYDACVSAAFYGVNCKSLTWLLRRMDRDFDYSGTGGIWASSVPTKKAGTASVPVRIAAALLANTGGVIKARNRIDDLAISFGGNPGTTKVSADRLTRWWNKGGDAPASEPVADTTPDRIRLDSQPNYCLTVKDGIWPGILSDFSYIVLNNYSCDGTGANTSEEFTFASDGTLKAGADPKAYCVTNGEKGFNIGAVPVLASCGSSDQQWRQYTNGTIHLYSDDNPPVDTGRCLTSKSATPNGVTDMGIATCKPADPAQGWQRPASDTVADTTPDRINLDSQPNYCLTVKDGIWPGILSDFSYIVLNNYSCDGADANTSEEFTFASDGTLKAGADPKTFCVTNGEKGFNIGAVPVLASCGSSDQQWRQYADRTIHLYSDDNPPVDTGRCLTSKSATPNGVTDMGIATCDPADPAQVWHFGRVPWGA